MSVKDTSKTSLQEAIAARIKKNNQLSDKEWRESIIGLKTALIDEKGPNITAAELARIVDVRLRSKKATELDVETIAREIEAAIELVEMCQWMLHIRRSKWTERVMNQPVDFSHNILTKEERKIKDAIYSKKTLTFEMGLKTMTMHGRTHARRAENYKAFLDWALQKWNWPASAPADWPWIELMEDDVKCPGVSEVFDRRSESGWPTARDLWNETKLWLQWEPIKKTSNKMRGGKAPRGKRKTGDATKKLRHVSNVSRTAK